MTQEAVNVEAEILRLGKRIEFLRALQDMQLTINQRALRELDRMLTTDPETYEAEQKLRTMAHAAMQVEDNWASSEDYDRQRENERLDAMASLIVEARGYDIHGRKK